VPELRRLRDFLAVASERNFTRAAESLHVAQPALSRQVRMLEQELGVELLHRTTHTFELTDAGRHLVERGPALLDAADELWRTTQAFGTGERGTVVVGYGASLGYETVPRLIRTLADRLPGLEVTTQLMPSTEILAAVRDGTVDVGAVRCPADADGLESRLLRLEPQGVLIGSADPRAAGADISLDQLDGSALLLHARDANPGHYDAVLALFDSRGTAPRVVHRPVALDVAQTPVAAGEAIAIVGESSRVGLPGDVTWLPLSPPTALETRLLARASNRKAAADRLLAAAEDVADELGWRDGHSGRR
jgi:DNA-binding transcriptional LysR family regulator